jgi:hypothetical protein
MKRATEPLRRRQEPAPMLLAGERVQLLPGWTVLVPGGAQFDTHARDVELEVTEVKPATWPGIIVLHGHDLALADEPGAEHRDTVLWVRSHLVVTPTTEKGNR